MTANLGGAVDPGAVRATVDRPAVPDAGAPAVIVDAPFDAALDAALDRLTDPIGRRLSDAAVPGDASDGLPPEAIDMLAVARALIVAPVPPLAPRDRAALRAGLMACACGTNPPRGGRRGGGGATAGAILGGVVLVIGLLSVWRALGGDAARGWGRLPIGTHARTPTGLDPAAIVAAPPATPVARNPLGLNAWPSAHGPRRRERAPSSGPSAPPRGPDAGQAARRGPPAATPASAPSPVGAPTEAAAPAHAPMAAVSTSGGRDTPAAATPSPPAPPTPAAPAIRPPETAPGPLPPTAHASVTPGATASLPATGIAGRVMDPDGLPIPGAVVVAEPFDGAGWFVVALAADDGTYALEIAPGRFRAHAEAPGHATRWWDDRPEPAAADPVIVAATGMVSGVDFRLPLASNPAVPTIAKEVVR